MNDSKVLDSNFDQLFGVVCFTPEILNIGTTNRCNLKCIHCAPASGPEQQHAMTSKEIIQVIDEFVGMGGRKVTFGGGEVFTRKDALSLFKHGVECGLFVNIESNGTLITPRKIEVLREWRHAIHFSISIDSLTPEIHDKFRMMPGAFQGAVKAINLLRKAEIPVTVITVLHQKNICDIEQIIMRALSEWDTDHRLLPFLNAEGRGASIVGRSCALPPEKVYEFLEERYWNLWRRFSNKFPNREIVVDIPRPFVPSEIQIFSSCLWGLHLVGLASDGTIGLCHYSSDEPGLQAGRIPKDGTLAELWFNSQFFKILRSLKRDTLKGICGNCIYGDTCRGLCRLSSYKKYKSIDAPYPVCQTLYEKGLFPREMLVDPKKDATYSHPTEVHNDQFPLTREFKAIGWI